MELEKSGKDKQAPLLLRLMKMARTIVLTLVAIAVVVGVTLVAMWLSQPMEKEIPDSSSMIKTEASSETPGVASTPNTTLLSGSARSSAVLTHSLSLPPVEGRLHLGRLLGQLGDWFGLDGGAIGAKLNFQIDLVGKVGSKMFQRLQKLSRGIVTFDMGNDRLTVTADRLKLRREGKRVHTAFRKLIETLFPEAATTARERASQVIRRIIATSAATQQSPTAAVMSRASSQS